MERTGTVDLPFIAYALDVGEDEAREALGDGIWLDPAGEVWRTAADYLSGDVVKKLEDARVAAETTIAIDETWLRWSVSSPRPLTRVDIRILCGAPWVPAEIYRGFLSEVLTVPPDTLFLNEISKKWVFQRKPEIPASTEAQFGTSRARAITIIRRR